MDLYSPEENEPSTNTESIHMEHRSLTTEPARSAHPRRHIHQARQTHQTAITLERQYSTKSSLAGIAKVPLTLTQ